MSYFIPVVSIIAVAFLTWQLYLLYSRARLLCCDYYSFLNRNKGSVRVDYYFISKNHNGLAFSANRSFLNPDGDYEYLFTAYHYKEAFNHPHFTIGLGAPNTLTKVKGDIAHWFFSLPLNERLLYMFNTYYKWLIIEKMREVQDNVFHYQLLNLSLKVAPILCQLFPRQKI